MKNQLIKLSSAAVLIALVSACGSDGNNDAVVPPVVVPPVVTPPVVTPPVVVVPPVQEEVSATYTVKFTNLTYKQPMAPAAIVLHMPGYNAFIDGKVASVALEQLAEGGSPTMLLDEAAASAEHITSMSSGGPTPPLSKSDEFTLTVPADNVGSLHFSFASMLINTNDAFTALNAANISDMVIGQSASFMTPTWDSGTEANLETAATMPGPAAGIAGGGGAAAGFDAARDDLIDLVHFHGGVVTNANATDASLEGLSTSILDESHRWNNPTAKVTITRTR